MADEPTTKVRVYLLDDHEVVRAGLRDLLEAEGDIEVVGESGSAVEAAHRIPALRPDVAVLDARLPDGSGIDVCREIRSVDPVDPGPDPDLVRRRRGAVRGDHGRRRGLRAQADPRHRSGRRGPPGGRRAVVARPGGHRAGAGADPRTAVRGAPELAASPSRSGGSSSYIAEGLTNRQIAGRCSSPRRR